MLLNAGHEQLLQYMIVNRERMNTGMNQSEVGQTIIDMTSAPYVKSMDHYKNLVRQGKMPGLKSGGQALKAQPTATKQIHITVTQHLRWHRPVDDIWDRIQETNLPSDSFVNRMENF